MMWAGKKLRVETAALPRLTVTTLKILKGYTVRRGSGSTAQDDKRK